MEQARDTGRVALTGKVELVQDAGRPDRAGAIMYAPIYRPGLPRGTREERRAALVGWISRPYHMSDLMAGALDEWGGPAGAAFVLRVHDGRQDTPASLLFAQAAATGAAPSPGRRQTRTLDFRGHEWLLVFEPGAAASGIDDTSAWATLFGGIALSVLLFGLVRARLDTQRDAARIAAGLAAELRQNEERLGESEFRWKFAIEGSGQGLWDWDAAAGTVFLSHRWKEMLGFADAEIGDAPDEWDRRLHPDDRAAALARVKDCLEGVRSTYVSEYRLRCKDGSYKWIHDRGVVVSRGADGRALRMIGVQVDITERKAAQAELEQHRAHLEELVEQRTAELMRTEERATQILDSSADGLYGVDREGRITFINPAACRLLGWTAEQVIGRSGHDLFHHKKPDGSPFPVHDCPTHTAVRLGVEVRVSDDVYWHAQGHALPVMSAVHPLVHDGVHAGAVISLVDMSEQRAAAQAREQAVAAAENLARLRSEFLANMSHEIRTPINGVLGFAAIGLRNYANGEKARNAFETILSSGQRLLGVVNEILDFSKIEAGRLRLERTTVRLHEVIAQAVEVVQELARAKHLALRVQATPDLPTTCLGDPLRIGQVLLNLLSNAVKFTEAGSVTLVASCVHDTLVLRVIDTGIGMNEAQLRQLFIPFLQADGSTTRRFGGTGLGLTIAKRLAELMGGDIRVESRLGSGSSFEFRMPCVRADDAAAAPPAATRPGGQPRQRRLDGVSVLVAEDEPISQMILREHLGDEGARVVVVATGGQAIERIERDGPAAYDIVLMDIQMPEMDGLQATREILARAPGLPIVGQTAHALSQERDKCFAAGMVAHIAKPIDPDALVRLVLQHARVGRARR
jgi:hypothetical protein